MKLKDYYWIYLSSFSLRYKIITKLFPGSRILDVGCGSCLPQKSKSYNKSIYYIGLDINNYLKSEQSKIDEYIICPPSEFAENISKFENSIDVVFSTHNLEHCDNPDEVIKAIVNALKPNGILYLTLPCEDSINFPHRRGTLNFYDDKTHKNLIKYNDLLNKLKNTNKNLEIIYSRKRFFPLFDAFIGFCLEPISKMLNKTMFGTWSLYAFETVIIAKKKNER